VIVYSSKVKIPYEDVVKLRNSGVLNLGISNSLAMAVSLRSRLRPKNKGVYLAFLFYSWIAALALGYTIYLSFTSGWWWFIIGLFAFQIIWRSNQKGNAENMLEEALRDKEFYNQILHITGWFYEIEEEELKKYGRVKAPSPPNKNNN